MKSFFEDGFIYSKVLSRLTKEIKEEQLDKTIAELSFLNKVQSQVVARKDFTSEENRRLDLIKKINNTQKNNGV